MKRNESQKQKKNSRCSEHDSANKAKKKPKPMKRRNKTNDCKV